MEANPINGADYKGAEAHWLRQHNHDVIGDANIRMMSRKCIKCHKLDRDDDEDNVCLNNGMQCDVCQMYGSKCGYLEQEYPPRDHQLVCVPDVDDPTLHKMANRQGRCLPVPIPDPGNTAINN